MQSHQEPKSSQSKEKRVSIAIGEDIGSGKISEISKAGTL